MFLAACGSDHQTAQTGQNASSLSIDGTGRVEISTAAAGESAEYVYDGAGNILEIKATPPAGVSVVDFRPKIGGIGEIVTVLGAGFSPTPSENQVRLNGTATVVLSATYSQLSFTVPAGATTGTISVTTGGNTATSAAAFTVATAVSLTDFTPKIGTVGTQLTITGINFDPNPQGDSVGVGAGSASVNGATYTTLLATVGAAATSGKVSVTAHSSTATSADEFYLLPGDYIEWDVGYTGRVAPGSPTSVDIAQLGEVGLVLFDGTQGEFVTLYVSGVTYAGSTEITVYSPSGAAIFSGSVKKSQESKLALPALPSSGTYTVVIQPASASLGTLDLQLFQDASAVLQAGSASTLTMMQGQNGQYTFAGNAGDLLSLACSAFTSIPSGAAAWLVINKPDGSRFWDGLVSSPKSWQLPALPATGTYTLLVRPSGTASASVTFLLSLPSVGTVAIDGSEIQFQTTTAGQSARYLFMGAPGDLVGLGVPVLATVPANGYVTFRLYHPNGSTLWSSSSLKATSWQLPQLTSAGTYTLVIQPSGAATISGTFLLSRPVTGVLSTDGTSTSWQTTRMGQSGRYTFSGIAGQRFTMQVTAGPLSNGAQVAVYQPSGASLSSVSFNGNSDTKINLGVLPAAGTYTVVVTPYGASTGQVTLRLVNGASDTLTIGDPLKDFTLAAAQNGHYTFTANAGDYLGFACTALSVVPSGGYLYFTVYKPDGGWLWSSNTYGPSSWQVPQLPATGNYTLSVQPSGTSSASFTVLLSRPVTGSLSPDGTAVTYQTTRAGQAGRYTFNATAGEGFSLRATAGSTWPKGVSVTVYQPSGATIATTSLSSNGDTKRDLGALPASGTYAAVLVPSATNTGTVDLQLFREATGTLVLDEPSPTLSLLAGQNGRYTFAGSSGDLLNLACTALSTTPVGRYAYFYVYKPDGATLWSGSASGPLSWSLPALPATGSYSLAVRPYGATAASFTLNVTRR